MLYPHVTEVIRAGNPWKPLPRSQRDLVALSLLLKPSPKARGLRERDHPRGLFR